MNQVWQLSVDRLCRLLSQLVFSDARGRPFSTDAAFERWAQWASEVRQQEKTVYLIGNGASASMASHFAADLAKNGHFHTQVFSDVSLLTAIANDIAFAEIYAEPLRRRGKKGDLLVAISSSGSSPNILRGVEIARSLDLTVVTLTGFSADNPLRRLGDLNGYVPAVTYGEAETGHAAILHCWMDMVEVKNETI